MKAIFPGSFDPATLGHLDIINRGAKLFDCLIVAILTNIAKKPLFSADERLFILQQETAHISNVEIVSFNGLLLVELAKNLDAQYILRGIRTESDCNYELAMAQANQKLNPHIETIFMASNPQNAYMSASLLKEIATVGYPTFDDSALDNWVSANVKTLLKNKFC
ncbi:MAG: pantetheine-phosphate adenylyltransferase [Defluviitaleaceae bacterium]|nr:pantetheine-phosphate adenylyltransferase [Defluviitaleaceae bacterium]